MISEKNAALYCGEDISLIENYQDAVNDKTQTWHLHHRVEITENKTRTQLIKENRYFNRPAAELVFLTNREHSKLHSRHSRDKCPLRLYFSDVGGDGCDWSHGDPYGLTKVSVSSKSISTYAKGSVVYVLDEEYAEIIKEQIEIEKEIADDPQNVDVFYVFDIEELVFMTNVRARYNFNTIIFLDGTEYTRKEPQGETAVYQIDESELAKIVASL